MQTSVYHPSWVEIDTEQLRKNISVVRNHLGKGVLYCLPVKANAYGYGLETVGKLAEKEGIDYLAVAHLKEALSLRQHDVTLPLLLLGAVLEDQVEDLINLNVEITISSLLKARLVETICKHLNKECLVHIEVDTGMQRTGMQATSAHTLLEYVAKSPYLQAKGIYSHFATSDAPDDPFVHTQMKLFETICCHPLVKKLSLIRHIANSGGVLFYKESYLDMVRPSLLTLGHSPNASYPPFDGIKPSFSIKSHVSFFKVVEEKTSVGYDRTFFTKKKTRIITIPIGYGDGYPRNLSNKGKVLIKNKFYPIVGLICMDQLMVDVGEDEVYVGDEVILIGTQGDQTISLENLASSINANVREILSLFNNRLPRKYYPFF